MTQAEEAEKQLREKNAELLKEIEERKRMEAEVRESEEKFRMIFENVLDGICIYVEDPDPFKGNLLIVMNGTQLCQAEAVRNYSV